VLTYGPITDGSAVDVTISFDHRICDAAVVMVRRGAELHAEPCRGLQVELTLSRVSPRTRSLGGPHGPLGVSRPAVFACA
jgi:hypothetical protein